MEDVNKKKYELAFLVDSEEDAQEAVKILNGHGAEIIFEGQLKKMDLAYFIEKRASAYFGFFHFQCEPENIKKIEDELRFNNKILRSMVVSPPIAPRVASSFLRRVSRVERAESVSERPHVSAGSSPDTRDDVEVRHAQNRQEMVSNEELEEKLEEILK